MTKQEEIAAGVARWTPERVETLQRMYKEDAPASAIAKALGADFTRNAVLGKIHRLRLPAAREPRPVGPQKPKPLRRAPAARRSNPGAARPSTDGKGLAFKIKRAKDAGLSLADGMAAVLGHAEVVGGLGDTPDGRALLRLAQLNESTCKWPFGDPLKPGFGFCGGHSLATSPYCEVHSRRAHTQAVKQ